MAEQPLYFIARCVGGDRLATVVLVADAGSVQRASDIALAALVSWCRRGEVVACYRHPGGTTSFRTTVCYDPSPAVAV